MPYAVAPRLNKRDCGDRPQENFVFDRIFETTCKIFILSQGSVPKSHSVLCTTSYAFCSETFHPVGVGRGGEVPPAVIGVGRRHAARPGP